MRYSPGRPRGYQEPALAGYLGWGLLLLRERGVVPDDTPLSPNAFGAELTLERVFDMAHDETLPEDIRDGVMAYLAGLPGVDESEVLHGRIQVGDPKVQRAHAENIERMMNRHLPIAFRCPDERQGDREVI